MDWQLLLLLACPLMMLFCMKGMFTGKKEKKEKSQDTLPQPSQQDLQSLQIKMADLMEQNEKLNAEVQSLKKPQASNVVDLKKGQEKKDHAEIS